MAWSDQLLSVGAALAAGLLIGIERGWTLRMAADGARVAGVRTFSLLGLLAGLAGQIASAGFAGVSGALVAGAAAVVAIGYGLSSKVDGRPDATSAVAALATLGLGFSAGIGSPAVAIAGAALVTLVLALRSEAHGLIGRLEQTDVKALARYAVIALAVFPLLPSGSYGPYEAWDPQKLWLVVVLVTGLSFAGYAANRVFGARHGTIVTAVIGGAYSSTAVTYSLAQRLGSGEGGGAENAGIALATTVMFVRVLVLVAALATSVMMPLMAVILPALVIAAGASLWLYWHAVPTADTSPTRNPIALVPALAFAMFVAAAAVAVRWAELRFGVQGIALLILIVGSMDVDVAIVTIGGLEPGALTPKLAALALGGTILVNLAVKLGVTLAYARQQAKGAAVALAASMISLGLGLAGGHWLL